MSRVVFIAWEECRDAGTLRGTMESAESQDEVLGKLGAVIISHKNGA